MIYIPAKLVSVSIIPFAGTKRRGCQCSLEAPGPDPRPSIQLTGPLSHRQLHSQTEHIQPADITTLITFITSNVHKP